MISFINSILWSINYIKTTCIIIMIRPVSHSTTCVLWLLKISANENRVWLFSLYVHMTTHAILEPLLDGCAMKISTSHLLPCRGTRWILAEWQLVGPWRTREEIQYLPPSRPGLVRLEYTSTPSPPRAPLSRGEESLVSDNRDQPFSRLFSLTKYRIENRQNVCK